MRLNDRFDSPKSSPLSPQNNLSQSISTMSKGLMGLVAYGDSESDSSDDEQVITLPAKAPASGTTTSGMSTLKDDHKKEDLRPTIHLN